MNFIEDFKDYILDHVPTSPDWASMISTLLLSSVLTRKTYTLNKLDPVHFNLFGMIVGPSGISYKTTPLKHMYKVLMQVNHKLGSREIIIPSRFTVEGMIKEFGDEDNRSGIMVRDEFTAMFKDMKNKKYMSGVQEFMSELFDGDIYSRVTVGEGRQNYVQVYINFITATTPYIFTVIDKGYFMQGTGYRFLYVYDHPRKIKKLSHKEFIMDIQETWDVNGDIEKFADKLVKLANVELYRIGFEEEAAKLITDYKYDMEEQSLKLYSADIHDTNYSYMVRMPEKCFKLSGLHCISRNIDELIEDVVEDELHISTMLLIREVDVEWAIERCNIYLQYYNDMLNYWSSTSQTQTVRTEKSEMEYVKSTIRNLGGEVPKTKLRRTLGWSNLEKFNEIMKLLVDNGEIYIKDGENKGKGAKGTVFCISTKV